MTTEPETKTRKKKVTISAIQRIRLSGFVRDDIDADYFTHDHSDITWNDLANKYAKSLGVDDGMIPVSAIKTTLLAFEVDPKDCTFKTVTKKSAALILAEARIKSLTELLIEHGIEIPAEATALTKEEEKANE